MLETIHIQGFKGFKDTHIGPLRKVNLVVGGQNVGKTSLLEAVWLAMGLEFSDPSKLIGIQNFTFPFRQMEGNDAERLAKSAFVKGFGEVYLHGRNRHEWAARVKKYKHEENHDVQVHTVAWFSKDLPLVKTIFNKYDIPLATAIPLYLPNQIQLVQLFGENVLARRREQLIEMLRQVETRLESLDAAAPFDIKEPRIYIGIKGIDKALSLPELGHGFARLLYVFCTLLRTDAKVALIDEVENGIHYSALPTLLQGIKNVAHDRDVQTLMTTHSWDCIRAACEVFADQPQDFQVIRLERTEDNIRAVCIDGERMLRLMSEGWEVR